jgi:seryl-tRNA synthetase
MRAFFVFLLTKKGAVFMLSIQWIRENSEIIQKVAVHKGIEISISELLAVDERRRALLQQVEQLRQKRNIYSKNIPQWLREGLHAQVEEAKLEVKCVNDELNGLESKLHDFEHNFKNLMLKVPNVVSPDTPIGRSDTDNVEIERWGEIPMFEFKPLDHIVLGEKHQIIDLARGVKTAGSRSYYLHGAGALLHRAVQQLALDILIKNDFTLLEVPLLARIESFTNTGFFPNGEDQTYRIEGSEHRLVGTSEVPLVNYYSGEIINVKKPLKLAAVSHCFRSEAGSASRDVYGLYRVHQFTKVEQVVLCEANPDLAELLLHEITAHAKTILQMLELPFRVVAVCTGDMSQKTYKQFDIETWMPSRGNYGETHSSSYLTDFQSRRAGIRYRDEDGDLRYCYTLNNTAIASPRILIPLLENHQQEDGSIYIPIALRPYMNGIEHLELVN